jgi:Metallo-peptidase family M12
MWQSIDEHSLDWGSRRLIVPSVYRCVRLNQVTLKQSLARAPMEFTKEATQNPAIIYLPMPDGKMARFRFEESPVMEPGLAAKFPGFKTYRAYGIDDPAATSRFDWLPTGFHAIILAPSGTVLIDPYTEGNTTDYITYWKKDAANLAHPFMCHVVESKLAPLPAAIAPVVTSGAELRTYRLAVAATNEYAVTVGGNTVAGTLAAEVLVMNRINGVYERDLAIHMNIIANNDLITYAHDNVTCGGRCTAENDPYTNDNISLMLGENQSNLDAVIGPSNYDIGHVFGTSGGGLAYGGVGCDSSYKGGGVTGLVNPVGDPFAIDYVAHELGHQWGASHAFNGEDEFGCGDRREASSAYEPGSGITIMGYAGVCTNQNLAAHSIDTFHVKSIEQIVAYTQAGRGNTCADVFRVRNHPPRVTGPGNFTIPKGTPFSLTASATDLDRDAITYDWEEYDLGASAGSMVPNTDADGQPRPLFRVYSPTVGGTRTFPSLQYILNNANVPPPTTDGFLTGELLPAISRAMTFQVVARDNRGGIRTASSVVTIDGGSGPFAVTFPNTSISVQALTTLNVTWNVAGTTVPPVNADFVKISLSTDGGNTFPTILASSTPNNGLASASIPNMPTRTARIKIQAVGNIFFDVSDANFTITSTPGPPPAGL